MIICNTEYPLNHSHRDNTNHQIFVTHVQRSHSSHLLYVLYGAFIHLFQITKDSNKDFSVEIRLFRRISSPHAQVT